ncbi:MAG TPA: sulfotransferase [Mycobacteriales bacterium]
MALPDFFVAGVPKAGTTALHVALAGHPDIFMSRVKEPKHFLTDGPPPQRGGPGDARTFRQRVWRREDYEALFDDAPSHALRGESTPFYLYLPQAQERIRQTVPDARLIVLLRDPVDRAHSNWSHLWSAGLEPEQDFVRACRLEDQRAAAGWALFWRYLDLGRYGEQLEALYSRFPREQVLPVRYRELRDSPTAVLDRICTFLGVDPGRIATIPTENVTTQASNSHRNRAISALLRTGSTVEHRLPARWWPRVDAFLSGHLQREQRPRQPLTYEQRAALIPHFADDVLRLEQLTGESFAAWRDPGRPPVRAALPRSARIGTAAGSIDRPIPDTPPV